MYILCLGMPCCGKTTFCRKHTHHVTFDFGGSWRRELPEASSEGLLVKFQRSLSDIIENSFWSNDLIYIDTYPEYINENILVNCPPLAVFVAIPDDWSKIYDRLVVRGDSKFFIDLYREGFSEWIDSWNRTFEHYKSILRNSSVEKINDYINQSFVDTSVNNILINRRFSNSYEDDKVDGGELDFLDFMVDDQCFLFNR